LPTGGALCRIVLTWPEGIASGLADISLARPRRVAWSLRGIDLAKALLGLRGGWACIDGITPRTVELIRNIPVVVGDSTAVDWIVHPVVAVSHVHAVEAVAIDKVVVNHHVVAAPSATPTPASPASAPNRTHGDAHAE
jgi:hypothetical protein